MDPIIEMLLAAPPAPSSGKFATTFADGTAGERGTYIFRNLDSWLVAIDGGPTMVCTPDGSLTTQRGTSQSGPTIRPTNRPPWSMVMPRLALIFGRSQDDWSCRFVGAARYGIVAGEILGRDGGAPVGHIVADLDVPVLCEIVTPGSHQTLDEVVVGLSGVVGRRLRDAQAAVRPWVGRPKGRP